MVAHGGRGWQLAPSLVVLAAEANRVAPGRSTRSDGSIGDRSHQARRSDHNPDGGWVDGLDLTDDPAGGFNAHAWVRVIAAHGDPRVDYLISNGQIHNPPRDGRGAWRPYGGSNPHTKHVHVSILDSGRFDLSPWLVGRMDPIGVAPAAGAFSALLDEEDEMAKLIRSDPDQGGTGAVIAVSGVLRLGVHTTDDFSRWQFLTAGEVAECNPETFDFFLRNTVDAQNINRAALFAQAATKE